METPNIDVNDKLSSIKTKLDSILADNDIEMAHCVFTIKNRPETIVVQQGHFYDITRMLSTILKDHYNRMRSEVGLP